MFIYILVFGLIIINGILICGYFFLWVIGVFDVYKIIIWRIKINVELELKLVLKIYLYKLNLFLFICYRFCFYNLLSFRNLIFN